MTGALNQVLLALLVLPSLVWTLATEGSELDKTPGELVWQGLIVLWLLMRTTGVRQALAKVGDSNRRPWVFAALTAVALLAARSLQGVPFDEHSLEHASALLALVVSMVIGHAMTTSARPSSAPALARALALTATAWFLSPVERHLPLTAVPMALAASVFLPSAAPTTSTTRRTSPGAAEPPMVAARPRGASLALLCAAVLHAAWPLFDAGLDPRGGQLFGLSLLGAALSMAMLDLNPGTNEPSLGSSTTRALLLGVAASITGVLVPAFAMSEVHALLVGIPLGVALVACNARIAQGVLLGLVAALLLASVLPLAPLRSLFWLLAARGMLRREL